jgi:glycosyltransferase involved in cell wall biosynthesis
MAAARRAGVPYVVSTHTGGHSSGLRRGVRQAQWRALGPLVRGARTLICVAEFEREEFARAAGVPQDRIAVVPNGITIGEPGSEAVPDPDAPTVVCVGRFERYKGQHHLIAALPALVRHQPAARLVLVGAGPAEEELRQQAADLGVAERVTFTFIPPAERDAMTDLVARAHVVALLSEYEAHPIAVMEAVALGRPVLVSAKAGLGELARNGLAESVPDPGDAPAVAAALARKLTEVATSLGTTRTDPPIPDEAPTKLPTWDDCAEQLAEIYRDSV